MQYEREDRHRISVQKLMCMYRERERENVCVCVCVCSGVGGADDDAVVERGLEMAKQWYSFQVETEKDVESE